MSNPYGAELHPADGQAIELNGATTHYTEAGTGDPLLLVHGSGPGNDGDLTWRPVLAALSASHRTIVVDAPGYGRSEMLDVADTPANVALHLLLLLDELGIERFAVAGHSRGGRISVEIALAAPERLSALMVVSAGSVAPDGLLDDEGVLSPSALALVQFGADGNSSLETFKTSYRTMVVDPDHLPDHILDDAYQDFMVNRYDEYIKRMQEFDPLAFYRQQDPALLKGIAVPTSIIWGRDDITSPYKRALPLLELIPGSELHLLPRCSHFVTADRPTELVTLMLDFMRRHR